MEYDVLPVTMSVREKKIHFIIGMRPTFGGKPLVFVHLLAILSACQHYPDHAVTVYYQYEPAGLLWETVKRHAQTCQINAPTEVFGRKLTHYAHAADVLRLNILIEQGGIYLDIDSIVVRPIADLVSDRVIMGIESREDNSVIGLCNAFIAAPSDNAFLRTWRNSYRDFDEEHWNQHSVQRPYELASLYPDAVAVQPKEAFFPIYHDSSGLSDLFERYIEIPGSYSIHLWESVAWRYIQALDAETILMHDTTYNAAARLVMASFPNELATISARAKPADLVGSLDRFDGPRTIWGWVKRIDHIGDGRDITVRALCGDRVVAEGLLLRSRPDIIDNPDYLVEFRLTSSEEIPDEVFASGRVVVEAFDAEGRTKQLPIYDRARSFALERALLAGPPMGRFCASAMLRSLAGSQHLSNDLKEALLRINDQFLEDETSRIVLQFESIGKDCSLGSIQRAFGAEPLGLLRFSGVGIDHVTAALAGRLEGIGSSQFTRMTTDINGEYFTNDTRYHMSTHTYAYEGVVDFDDFYQKQCRKLQFLARNLMEKIEIGEKILVVHALPEDHRRRIGTTASDCQADWSSPLALSSTGDRSISSRYGDHAQRRDNCGICPSGPRKHDASRGSNSGGMDDDAA